MDHDYQTATSVTPSEETTVHGESEATVSEHQPAVALTNDSEDGAAQTNAVSSSDADVVTPYEEMYTPVYNGETVPIKASEREEITTLLQLGMKQRDLLPMYETMTRLAHEEGERSLKAWVEKRVNEREELLRRQAIERYGEEDGTRFYTLEKAERERRFRELSDQQQLREEQRQKQRDRYEEIASEFCALCEMHPNVTAFRQVPDEVFRIREEEGISLVDAYNRTLLLEQRRVANADAVQCAAAEASTGSLSSSREVPPSAMDAFRAGLRRRA